MLPPCENVLDHDDSHSHASIIQTELTSRDVIRNHCEGSVNTRLSLVNTSMTLLCSSGTARDTSMSTWVVLVYPDQHGMIRPASIEQKLCSVSSCQRTDDMAHRAFILRARPRLTMDGLPPLTARTSSSSKLTKLSHALELLRVILQNNHSNCPCPRDDASTKVKCLR